MKANQTKVKKKGRTVRAFKRDLSLWLFCVPGVVLTFIFRIIKVLEGLPNLLRGFSEGFTIKTSIVVEGSS